MNSPRSDALPRRSFLKASAVSSLGLAMFHGAGSAQEINSQSEELPITVAGYPYDRVRALANGSTKVKGCRTTFEPATIGPMNVHVFNGPQTREVTEVGLLPFVLAFCNDGFRDYELLPIPVLRLFRHKSIFIRTDRDISEPADLRGRRIATVGYSSSGLTWIRGILHSEYGVSPNEVEWITTQSDSAKKTTGGASKWEKLLPSDVSIRTAPPGKDESQLLLDGEVDAILHPAEPKVFVDRNPIVARLFPDHRSVERAYYKKTEVFPIMHVVAIRRDAAATHPWLPRAVFEAYCQAKRADYELMHNLGSYYSSLPWHGQELNETRALMGENFYPYGASQIQKAMETAFQYAFSQGLAKRKLALEEVLNASSVDFEEPRYN